MKEYFFVPIAISICIHSFSQNVGIGNTNPNFKLTIASSLIEGNNNTHVLSLRGRNPVLNFSNENDVSYGYIKMWTNAPFAPYTNGLVIGANPGYPLFFSTNNYGVSLYIADNGNVGIGTTTVPAKLNVVKDAESIRLTGSGAYLSFYNDNAYRGYLWSKEPNEIELGTSLNNTAGSINFRVHGIEGFTLQNDGIVRVGTVACSLPAQGTVPKLSVQGPLGFKKDGGDNIGEWAIRYGYPTVDNPNGLVFIYNGGVFKAFVDEFDGSWRASSDARLKENFQDYKPVLENVKNLKVLTYQYKTDKTGHTCFGLVAQNLKQYFPELVSGDEKNKDQYMAIAYDKTGVLAIKAIQEQQAIIEMQQNKIEALEKKLATIEARLQ